MSPRNRKLRLGIVLAVAVVAAFVAWRMSQTEKPPECVAGRQEVKDPAGKIIEIRRISCN